MKYYLKYILLSFLLLSAALLPQKKVYIIFGSDTAVWEGMATDKFVCHYEYNVIPDATRNYFKAMQPAFRNSFTDSFGGHLKLTWWLMGGNIFRYADNNNVPFANTIVPYLAKKYYGGQFLQYGDELSLHYHPFAWTDYNGDGVYFWNQAKNVAEYAADMDYTLAQYLLEENIFPVSFRAGWNFMDNGWQNYLDKLLPYSMHNQYPAVRSDSTEPIDNVYDWSRSSAECVPFHPSPVDYQKPGNLRGYELRSINFGGMNQALMNSIFAKANAGTDQVVCLWAHVWDEPFLTHMQRIDTISWKAVASYPGVQFKYCTAVEAMRLWKNSSDATPPEVSFTEETSGNAVRYIIQSDEPVFQEQPFVAVKDIYEKYARVNCVQTGSNRWQTSTPLDKRFIAKAGVAVTDTVGNLTTKFINSRPDDIFVDNESPGYSEPRGTWLTITQASWGLDARQAALTAGDSVKVVWSIPVGRQGIYNIFVQVPKIANPCSGARFRVYSGGIAVLSKYFAAPLTPNEWIFIGTINITSPPDVKVELTATGDNNAGKNIAADVVKVSALVRPRELFVRQKFIDFGAVSRYDTARFILPLSNRGIEEISITGLSSGSPLIHFDAPAPFVIPPMGTAELGIRFSSGVKGVVNDTIYIQSNDPDKPVTPLPFTAIVEEYFITRDDGDTLGYRESGTWAYSVAHAFGSTSRYAYVTQSPKPYAEFTAVLKMNGYYDVSYIVPATVNASTNTLYLLSQGPAVLDSVLFNQNTNSGGWVKIGTYTLAADVPVKLLIRDAGPNTAGIVLRADAVKFALHTDPVNEDDKPGGGKDFYLLQNYPNPFNPVTTISYYLPHNTQVNLTVYDMLGNVIRKLADGYQAQGRHEAVFNGSGLSSGIYWYHLRAENFSASRKFLLVK